MISKQGVNGTAVLSCWFGGFCFMEEGGTTASGDFGCSVADIFVCLAQTEKLKKLPERRPDQLQPQGERLRHHCWCPLGRGGILLRPAFVSALCALCLPDLFVWLWTTRDRLARFWGPEEHKGKRNCSVLLPRPPGSAGVGARAT